MNETLADQLARIKAKLDAQGYVKCPECLREVTKLRPQGICIECIRAKGKPQTKKPAPAVARKENDWGPPMEVYNE